MAQLIIESKEIYFKNFRGRELPYNPAGKRTFWVRIDGRKAKKLKKEGWSIKEIYINEAKTKKRWCLPVTIYESLHDTTVNSRVYANISIGNRDRQYLQRRLNRDSIGLLDVASITRSQLNIFGYKWDIGGKQVMKAYLRSGDFYISDTIPVTKLIDFLEKDGFAKW